MSPEESFMEEVEQESNRGVTTPCRVLFIDTETTGTNRETDEVIEIAMQLVTYPESLRTEQDVLLETPFQSVFRPSVPIAPEASGVHNIIDTDLSCSPPLSVLFGSDPSDQALLFSHLFQQADYLCGHNLDFDLTILKRQLSWWETLQQFDTTRVFDTLRMCRRAFPELPDYKLASLRYRFGLLLQNEERNIHIHGALDDVKITRALFEHLTDIAERAVGPALYAWSFEPILIENATFGKYKGDKYTEIVKRDRAYLEWLSNQDWLANKYPSDYDTIVSLLGLERG